MGTWDRKNFGNDDAMDFISEFESGDIKVIDNILNKISKLSTNEYLEAPDCQAALAAGEVLAYLRGNSAADFPDELKDKLKEVKLADLEKLIPVCILAINRIETNSELKELWKESPEYQDWVGVLEDLKNRLNKK